jgi:hypothetical protein
MQSDEKAISRHWKCALPYENGRLAGLDFRGAQSPRGGSDVLCFPFLPLLFCFSYTIKHNLRFGDENEVQWTLTWMFSRSGKLSLTGSVVLHRLQRLFN